MQTASIHKFFLEICCLFCFKESLDLDFGQISKCIPLKYTLEYKLVHFAEQLIVYMLLHNPSNDLTKISFAVGSFQLQTSLFNQRPNE